MRPETQSPVILRPAPHRRFVPLPSARELGSGLYADEPATCRRSARVFVPVLIHLVLLLAVFRVYRVETPAFRTLVTIALGALPIHYLLPFRWKKPFFVAVSIFGLSWIVGAATAGCVLAVSAVMIGVCYAPIVWGLRAAIVAAIALVLANPVAAGLAGTIPDMMVPVLSTMFMFRMIVYLYELKHARKPEPLVDTLSYFFLLPNYCFRLFPVVDYRTLQRGYFARDVHSIQRTGLQMMLQGTVQLLLYRLIYHEWEIRPEQVHNIATLAHYLTYTYLLYLHVSGQFHVACGMLHLFGFQLPETHHNYLLATGFTDYWRRINIYWKDFMVRVVFNPVVFRLRRWSQPVALAVATAAVFVATWLLHAYQTFWLKGNWSFSVPDALFWGILGALVMVNVQLDARRPRGRAPKGARETPRQLALRAVKIAATFTTIALLWSLWSSPSVGAWLAVLQRGMQL